MAPTKTPPPLRIGLVAPKNTRKEQTWLLGFLSGLQGEIYRAGRRYDVVWFLNVTPELRRIKQTTDAKCVVVGMEPMFRYPPNYDRSLIDLADLLVAYHDFRTVRETASFRRFTFPIYSRNEIERKFAAADGMTRDHDFCLFAHHDPNIRQTIAKGLANTDVILGGDLFGRRFANKWEQQVRCRYEFITENDINGYYVSEKIGQALCAGCVPVYLGCERVEDLIPSEMFVDLRAFLSDGGQPDMPRLLEHLRREETYVGHRAAIRAGGLDLLHNRFSIEGCLVEPLSEFCGKLDAAGWRSSAGTVRLAARRAWRATHEALNWDAYWTAKTEAVR